MSMVKYEPEMVFAATEGSANNPGYGFFTNGDTNMGMYRIAADQLGFSTDGTEAMRIDASRNVGIGPTFAGGTTIASRLHVDGDIRAEGDILYNGDATDLVPDYVFQKYYNGFSSIKDNYRFKSLKEIEKYVQKNNHLPGVTSAIQAQKDGFWNLSQSNLQNLEKIEELFLHTIEQEKKIEVLKSENETLNSELESLKKDMAEIKALLQSNTKGN